MLQEMPKAAKANKQILEKFEDTKEAITAIRNVRKDKNLPLKEELELIVRDQNGSYSEDFETILKKLGILSSVTRSNDKPEAAISFRVRSVEYFIPLEDHVNPEEELKKLEEELKKKEIETIGVIPYNSAVFTACLEGNPISQGQSTRQAGKILDLLLSKTTK